MKSKFGFYIETRPRSDGRVRLRFAVPERLRPLGWPASRPLYLDGEDGIDLDNLTAAQEAELTRQATQHYTDFRMACASAVTHTSATPPPDTSVMDKWRRVLTLRRDSERWHSLKERTHQTYGWYQENILRVAQERGLDIATTSQAGFEAAFRAETSSKSQRKLYYSELTHLAALAIEDGLRPVHMTIDSTTNPIAKPIVLWTPEDVYALVTECLRQDDPGLGKLLLTQWEIGQRLTSVRNLRYGHNYEDGYFYYKCRKTEAPIRLKVLNPTAIKILDRDYRYGDYIFLNRRTGLPFEEEQLTTRFAYVRDTAPGFKGSGLQLRCMRHSVLVGFGRAGATIPEIAAVTGHSLHHAYRTLNHYMTQDERAAAVAMAKREKMRIDGVEGEQLIDSARRVWIGHQARTALPLTPRELKLYGPV